MAAARVGDLLREMYQKLWEAFGPQGWWPGETPFEVILGAILTQNTNWRNVAQVIAALEGRRPPDAPGLAGDARRGAGPAARGPRATSTSRPGG